MTGCATSHITIQALLVAMTLSCSGVGSTHKINSDASDPSEIAPVLVSIDPPVYPQLAMDAGVEGEVLVRVLVGTDGRVKDTQIAQGVVGLNEAAIDCAITSRWKPAMKNGQPVELWMILPIEYELP